jgi:hypothetical protein
MQVLLTSLLLWWFYDSLRTSWNAGPARTGTGYVIRPSPGLRFLGWAMLALGPTTSWLMVTTFKELQQDATAHWIASFVGGTAALLGLSVILRCERSFIFYSDRGIVFRSTRGKFRHLRWAQVQTLEYQKGRGRLVFRSRRAALPIGLVFRGFSGLLDQMRTSLPPAMWSAQLAQLENDLWRKPLRRPRSSPSAGELSGGRAARSLEPSRRRRSRRRS